MDEKILGLITKIVKETLEKEEAVSKDYMVPIGVSARYSFSTRAY